MISFTDHSNADAGDYCLIPSDANVNRIKTSAITADVQATDIARAAAQAPAGRAILLSRRV